MNDIVDAVLKLKDAMRAATGGDVLELVVSPHAFPLLQSHMYNFESPWHSMTAVPPTICGVPINERGQMRKELMDAMRGVIDLVDRGLLGRTMKDTGDGVRFAQEGIEVSARLKACVKALRRAEGAL